MRQPSRTGGKKSGAKARNASATKGRKTTKTKRGIAPAVAPAKRRPVPASSKELKEAREQQAATAEILKVIASSPDDVQPVLEAVAERTMSLLDAWSVLVTRFDGKLLHFGAARGALPDTEQFLRNQYPMRPEAAVFAGRCILERSAVNISDARVDPSPQNRDRARLRGFRAALSVPMLHNGKPIGVITVSRREAGAFAANEVELLQTFADQAVIAIENVRLFDETKEALARQTATSDILRIISQSPTDVQPVFDAIVLASVRLLECDRSVFVRCDSTSFWQVALAGSKGLLKIVDSGKHPIDPDAHFPSRAIVGKTTLHLPDWSLIDLPVFERRIHETYGITSALYLPLVREGECIGVLALAGTRAGMFGESEITLAESFRDQALIAIENTRLFNEVRERTRDLAESLEQQTATSEVLATISSSLDDLAPLFQKILENAVRVCGAKFGTLALYDGTVYDPVASCNVPREYAETLLNRPFVPHPKSATGSVAVTHRPVQVEDLRTQPAYLEGHPAAVALSDLGGARTLVVVPMLKDDRLVGIIGIFRQEVNPFNDKQIALLSNFAQQAVIAIENNRLLKELRESLQQQTATADVLKVISRSAFDLQPVFDTIVQTARRLCDAEYATIYVLRDDDKYHVVANNGADPVFLKYAVEHPMPPKRGFLVGRTALERKTVHLPDCLADTEYSALEYQSMGHYRSMLGVPLLREGVSIGVIALMRTAVLPFTEKQIELVTTFADQAVIAIENVRLFDEVQAKTRDLTEALTYQTGSANILKVIASSPTDVGPVLKAIVETACELCEAYDSVLVLKDGQDLRFSAHHGPIPMTLVKWPINRNWTAGRAFVDQRPVHVHDLQSPEGDDFPDGREMSRRMGHRTILSVPLLSEGESIGTIVLRRTEVYPFNDKQINLLQTFADQAVIAIGNVRLFEEVQAKTRDLTESLQQQTATADVLKVISRSSVELEKVLETLVDTVARLCGADQVYMFHLRHDLWHLVAAWGLSAEAREFFLTNPFTPGRGSTSGRAALERRAVLIRDVLQDPEYTLSEGQKIAGYRTTLGIPLLREDTLIGVFSIVRTRVEAFTQKEIELATTFADQAVIAIENARLFDELRDRQAELRVTFDNMGDGVVMFDAEGRLAAWNRNFQEMLDLPDAFLAQRPSYAEYFHYLADRGEYSTDLEAQLSRTIEDTSREMRFERVRPDGRVIEARRNPVPGGGFVLIYSDITERKHAEEAIRTARDAAEAALRDLQTAQDRLIQTEKLASLGQLTAGIAHEIKNPLNFVNNFSALTAELTDELNDLLKPAPLDDKMRGEADELTGMIKDNLRKVVQHGKRADSIVKNMLLHSREGSREHRPADINSLLDESLNLAYHGARAEKGEFNITLQRDFDAEAGTIELFPQEITRAFLNLIANGVYAATRRKTEEKEPGFEPTLRATTKNLGTTVEIRIRDNGTGIPAEVREKMFNPFFTTKPAGEGTGLGLSMTHDIIVKQHGGRIDVATEPGQFTEFIIVLPRKSIVSDRERSET